MDAMITPMPPVARGRNGADTLFSAEWFDDVDTGRIPFASDLAQPHETPTVARGPSLRVVLAAVVVGVVLFATGGLTLMTTLIAWWLW